MPELLNVLNTEQLAKAAKDEVGEDPKRLKEDLQALKAWISQSPHLATIRQDDMWLSMFLRGCKFSLERTKEKLDFHFTVRGNLPSWFSDWDPRLPELAAYIKAGVYLPLPGYDRHGRRVVIMRNSKADPNTMKPETGFKVSTMIMTRALEGDVQAQVKGIVLLQDMEGLTASHAVLMTPTLAKTAMTVWMNAYPSRPKALHFINMPSIIEGLFKLFESFQKEKLRERNKVHPKGDLSGMIADLGKEILPEEYGGTNGTVEELKQYWIREMESSRDWLMKQATFKTDESKRPGKPKLHADIFGIEGSFRKLEID